MNWRRRNRPRALTDVAPHRASIEPDDSVLDGSSGPEPDTGPAPRGEVGGDGGSDSVDPDDALDAAAQGDEEVSEATTAPGESPEGPEGAAEESLDAGGEPVEAHESAGVEDPAIVLTVLNQKGGVGKTTTTVSLGAALAEDGLRVLVVDLDPQGNATTGLGLRVQEGAPSTYRVIVEGMEAEAATEATSVRRLHVLPSSLDLAGAEIELVPQFSREGRLRKALDEVRGLYDVILVDCPPSLGLLTINGLVAADQVIVPIQCEYYALEGLGQLLRTVELVRTSLNSDLELAGVLMTMYDGRTNLSQQVVDEVRAHFGEQAFRTIIPRTVRLSEAPSYGQPITIFDPSSRGARAYQRLSAELAQRLGLRTASAGMTALDRLLGTAAVPQTDDSSVPPPPPPEVTEEGLDGLSRSLPTDLPPPTPPTPDDEHHAAEVLQEHAAPSALAGTTTGEHPPTSPPPQEHDHSMTEEPEHG